MLPSWLLPQQIPEMRMGRIFTRSQMADQRLSEINQANGRRAKKRAVPAKFAHLKIPKL